MRQPDAYWVHNPASHTFVGPYTLQQLSEFAKTGQVSPVHLINLEGTSQWVRFDEAFPEIAPAAALPPVPQPQPPSPATAAIIAANCGWLICLAGPDKGARIPVQSTEAIVGRGMQSPVRLNDHDAGEQHLKILLVSAQLHFVVADGHTVLLNGIAVPSGQCQEGDQLQIGDSVWVYDAPDAVDWVFRKIASGMSVVSGIDALEAFSFKTLLSDMFHKRSEEEIERHVMIGTPATTPPLDSIPTFWPKPWLFYRAFLFFLGAFAVLAGTMFMFNNPKLIPALTILGAVGMPLAITVLFFELNTPQNVSIYRTLRVLVMGGVLSLALTHLGLFIPSLPAWLGASRAAPIEEIAKLFALLLIVRGNKYPWTLNGLLFGAAVGAGFGIFETAGYAMEANSKGGFLGLMLNTFIRSVLSPGMHVAWTALVGAALWRVKHGKPFHFAMLLDFRFLRVFLLAIIAHMIWNSPLQLPFFGNNFIVTLALWFALLSLVQYGLNEIREAKKAALAVPPVLA